MPLFLEPETDQITLRTGRVVEALEATRRSMRRYRAAMALVGAALTAIGLAVVEVVADVSWVLPSLGQDCGPRIPGQFSA